jgi:hypothetical protein
MTAAAPAAAAARKTSRGWTMLASTVPIERRRVLMTRWRESSSRHAELLDGARCRTPRRGSARASMAVRILRPLAARADQRTASRLDRGDQLRGARGADTRDAAQLVRSGAGEAVQAADGREHRVGQRERVGRRAAVPEHDGEQLVVAEYRWTARSSFSRGRSCGATVFIA